jgi:hypothetical protein
MNTLIAKTAGTVSAKDVRFVGDKLVVKLSDWRELSVPYKRIPWLKWLAKATAKQRSAWSIEPGGYAIYWEQLDDGVEISHLLGVESLN